MSRICHLTSVHQRYDVRIFMKECISLAKEHEVYLVVADGKGDEVKEGVYIRDTGVLTSRKDRFLNSAGLLYNRAMEIDAEVYHFHDPELIPLGLKLKKKGKKVIYDIHEDVVSDILTKKWIPKLIRKPVALFFKQYQYYAVKKFDYIITATPFIEGLFIKYNKAKVINNFPQIPEREKFDYDTKNEQICYAGLISERRGLNQMVDSFEEPVGKFIIAGRFEEESLLHDVEKRPGWKNINYVGSLPFREAEQVRDTSKIGLLLFHPGPNHTDSQPNKLFEYMEAGLAVVCSNFPLWRDLIEKNNCGICVDPYNVSGIRTAIKDLLGDQEKCREMGLNGRKLILEKYNWKHEAIQLNNIYKTLLNS
ncbi:glycosyltransferase [Chitinophaga sp. RAB17]|uniref:glycosyltransferase n=1 Tax=Chitinophaga sp. RAB17 TaxID=3233049 RepID=UPI003F8EF610